MNLLIGARSQSPTPHLSKTLVVFMNLLVNQNYAKLLALQRNSLLAMAKMPPN
jgi:hypothetical protein